MEKEPLIKYMKKKGILKYERTRLKDETISDYFITTGGFDDGEGKSLLTDVFAEEIFNNMGFGAFDFIYGPTYKGIPISSTLSQKIFEKYGVNKRDGYMRKNEKDYGLKEERIFVGDLRRGDRVLIVDDVVTLGKTKIEEKEKLENMVKELTFTGILVLVDRCENKKLLYDAGLKIYSIFDINELLKWKI
jgi:orotate phosphoribosyltransferase